MTPMSDTARHPGGLVTLFFTEMWERMSYYGMRALLTLYMADQVTGMKLTDKQATSIYGLYTALVYIMALPGGWAGDRVMGPKRAVWWGGVVIAAGHVVLGLPATTSFYIGLVIVACGSGLLKSNMSTLVSQLYPEGGARRDAGFSLFYMGINIGAFTGQLLCPWLAQAFGWRWGFSAAAAGMFLGLVQFQITKHRIAHIGEWYEHAGQNVRRDRSVLVAGLAVLVLLTILCAMGVVPVNPVKLADWTALAITAVAVLFFGWTFILGGLDSEEKKRVLTILVLCGAAALFFAGFEQAGSSFSLFAERYTLRTFGSVTIPAGQFQSLNSLMVIALAPVMTILWTWMRRRNCEPLIVTKFAWGLLMLAGGFWVASIASQRAIAAGAVAPTWLITIYVLHTIGELFLSPVGLSAVSKLAPRRLASQMMGVWFLGSALGNILAGLLAGEVTGDAAAQMPSRFMDVVMTTGLAGVMLWILARPIQKLMPGVK
jgi:proton-dependent oligopeptide transporter, POT family